MNNRFGIHIRLMESLVDLVHKANRLDIPFFQCLLVQQDTGKIIEPSAQEIAEFRDACTEYGFNRIFLHASYYSNLCNPAQRRHSLLLKELALAHKLGCTDLVIHAGSVVGTVTRESSIKILADTLDWLLETQDARVRIILENTAHEHSIGSSLDDFKELLTYMRYPGDLSFCIDTAHAYAVGYDLAVQEGVKLFLSDIEQTVGFERVALLHANNTDKTIGSFIDQHASLIGGKIPLPLLKQIINNAAFKTIPVILELPVMTEAEEKKMLECIQKEE